MFSEHKGVIPFFVVRPQNENFSNIVEILLKVYTQFKQENAYHVGESESDNWIRNKISEWAGLGPRVMAFFGRLWKVWLVKGKVYLFHETKTILYLVLFGKVPCI